jgi:hypothetical protein
VTITRSPLERGVGQVLGLAAPDVHLEEAGVAVAPFAVLLDALGDGDAQVGDGDAGVGEAEFGIVDQLPTMVVWLSAAMLLLLAAIAGG